VASVLPCICTILTIHMKDINSHEAVKSRRAENVILGKIINKMCCSCQKGPSFIGPRCRSTRFTVTARPHRRVITGDDGCLSLTTSTIFKSSLACVIISRQKGVDCIVVVTIALFPYCLCVIKWLVLHDFKETFP
jgi:hypothetical protein